MHFVPRLDLKALYLALALATMSQAALYAAARTQGLKPLPACAVGIGVAALVAICWYKSRARAPWKTEPCVVAAAPTKKKRARKEASAAPAAPTLDPAWGLRAASLLLGALAMQLSMVRAGLVPTAFLHPQRAEAVTFGVALLASIGLLAWGARYWLQALCPEGGQPTSPWQQRIRDYMPAAVCGLGTWGMLWVSVPALFQGEMNSDLAQGLFFAAYEGAPWRFDGEGVAWLPQVVAGVSHALHASAAWVPYLYQGVACWVLAACVSAFAWPAFRRLLPSDLARFLICAALACQPDYTQKTLTHVGGYVAMVALLLVWLALCQHHLTWRLALGAGAWVAALALSHPAGVALAPALLVLLVLMLARKQLPQAAFCALAAVGPWVQVWALALPHRAASAGAEGDAGAVGALIAQYSARLPAWGVGGKALLALNAGDDGAYVLWICAGGAAMTCLIQVLLAPGRRHLIGLLAVALTTAAAGVACHVLMAPEAASALLANGSLVGLAAPPWFLPCVAVFLALAVGIGSSSLNKHVPWALCLWLFAGYPFGLGQLPRSPYWPAQGFSAWQSLAPKVLGQTPPRGCIPVNPFPTYLGMDCQLLHSVGSATGLGGWMTFFNEVALTVPAPAEDWSVDSIGIAFNKTPPLDAGPWEIPVTLVALADDETEIGRAEAVFYPPEIFTYFTFEKPLDRVAKTKLVVAAGASLAMGIESQETREPFWVWFGRGEPEEGGEGVHLAEH